MIPDEGHFAAPNTLNTPVLLPNVQFSGIAIRSLLNYTYVQI